MKKESRAVGSILSRWSVPERWIRSRNRQVWAWRTANRRMGWGIPRKEFARIPLPFPLSDSDREEGFLGSILCYGFGNNGEGCADAVLSGRLAWEYAEKRWKKRTWKCRYVHFDRPDFFRMRPGAPPRPKGFYFVKFHPGLGFQHLSVTQVRKMLGKDTGCGPEGLQLLAVTHPHLANRMNRGSVPFMALADYDIAPYGFNDFFDAPQLFCSRSIVGLGMGNVSGTYPRFAVPVLRFEHTGTPSPAAPTG